MNTNTISTTVKKYTVAILITSQFILSVGVATATTTPEIVPDDNQSTEPEATEEAVGLDVDYETDSDGEVLVDSEAPAIGSEDASASSSVEIDSIAEGAGVSISEGDISETGQSSSTTESSNSDIEDSMTTATGSSSTEENVASTTNQALASSTDIILEESISAVEQLTYKKLMKRYNEIAKDRDGSEPETSALADDLNEFVAAETSRLEDLGVAEKRIKQYVDSLTEKQIWLRDKTSRDPNWLERSVSKIKHVFGLEKIEDNIQIPKNLPTFEMAGDENIQLEDITYTLDTGEEGVIERVIEGIKAFFVTEVEADTASLPVIGDIATSTGPSASNYKIHELAIELDHNPVNIYNYLKNNFEFESYYGALKGADGCLADMACNDVDLTALAVALYRESGIPARYKKVEAVITPGQMTDLVGTQDVNTALQTLIDSGYFAGITAGTYDPEGTVLETDLSGVTQVVVEWMIPQIFVSYDAAGGNYSNGEFRAAVLEATSTDSLRTTLQSWKDGQWVDAETFFVQSRTHTVATEVVPESFDVVSFWEDYLEYSGSQDPYGKFYDDLTASTSKDITEAQYQTSMVINDEVYSRIPVTSRFLEGTVNEDPVRETEYFSDLSGVWLPTVEYRLIDRDTEDEVFSFETEAHLIDEVSGDLFYTGETSTDISTIESYGGIAQTPATLVSIIPVLTLSDGTYVEGSEGLTIGQQLIFEIIFDPMHEDPKIIDKFATAGNDEGVYVAFSKISENPDLDNSDDPDQDSKILLKGNSEIVRQYFKRLQEERALYTRAFNIVEIPTIQAGTITQTRVLEEDVNGFPTTFDFSGLGLNAFAKVVLSDRNKDQDQRVNAAYLTGLSYSDYEGQVFDDITGLSGIATIQGFQYAHASSSYTVYKITPDDRSDLSNLNLSSTTIENMDDALDQGRIVYTPDNLIVDGEWRGIVYITVDPETGSATYAIGEQVQNGGWTKNSFEGTTVTVGGKEVDRYKNIGSSKTYVFADSIGNGLGSINCRISNTNFSVMLSLSGYQASYGIPCLVGSTEFSDGEERTYAVATDGARLDGTWVRAIDAYEEVKDKMDSYPDERYGQAFRFSATVGTYAHDFCADYGFLNCPSKSEGAAYYNPDNGNAYAILGDYWKKYTNNGSEAAEAVGYPTSDVATAASYDIANWPDTDGTYQNFVAGQIIKQTSWNNLNANTIAYLPDPIAYCHNHPTSCGTSGSGGTGGTFGFPQGDPIKGTDNKYYQTFGTGKQIIWNTSNGNVDSEDERKYRCEIYGGIGSNSYRVFPIVAHGLSDSGLSLTSSVYQLLASVVGVVASPIDTTEAAYKTAKEYAFKARGIDLDSAEVLLGSINDAAANAWLDVKEEYDQSFGSNGCYARQWYMEGYTVGVLAETAIPLAKAGKLGNASKLADLNKAASGDAGDKLDATKSILSGVQSISSKFKTFWDNTLPARKTKLIQSGAYQTNESLFGVSGNNYLQSPTGAKRTSHILYGDFNTDGSFAGGLHSGQVFDELAENGLIQYKNLQTNSNGVRKVEILKSDGNFEPNKTFFPSSWSDEDIVESVADARSQIVGNPGFGLYSTTVNKNGITLEVKVGLFSDGRISTAYPEF